MVSKPLLAKTIPVLPTRQGSFRLFRLAGIDVHLHWSWFLIAAYQVTSRDGGYTSPAWNAVEYLALFSIVLMHEFGHALACRQVGGQAELIVLWPLGGVAYVNPPQRPGATLWSIAAGPLVNVVLVGVLSALLVLAKQPSSEAANPDWVLCLRAVWFINLALLVFNLLPVYPLDGGQMLRSLLWFVLGRIRSLQVATVLGMVGAAGLLTAAVWTGSVWFGIMAAFLLLNGWRGFQSARGMARLADLPRHRGFACPACHASPPQAELWICGRCQQRFDTFLGGAKCPQCGELFPLTVCTSCGQPAPFSAWLIPPPKLPPGA